MNKRDVQSSRWSITNGSVVPNGALSVLFIVNWVLLSPSLTRFVEFKLGVILDIPGIDEKDAISNGIIVVAHYKSKCKTKTQYYK